MHSLISFCVEVADHQTPVWFKVVSYIAAKVLLGNEFYSRYAKTIHPKAGLVRLTSSRPIPILAVRNDSVAPISIPKTSELTLITNSSLADNNQDIHVAQRRTIAPKIQYFISVMKNGRGLVAVEQHRELPNLYLTAAARGIS